MKGTQLLHGSFLLFNSAHLGEAGALVEESSQVPQLIGCADGVNLDASVVFIAHPAAQAECMRVLFDEPAEPDTLYSAGDEPPASLDQ